jgi:hypothetical protein
MVTEQAQLLRDFIDGVARYTGIERSDGSPQIVRRTNPSINMTNVFVASFTEPHELLLPENAIWIQYNSSLQDYKWVYRRVSRDPDAAAGTTHTWERVTTYDALFIPQFYNEQSGDLPDYDNAGIAGLGLVQLSVQPADPADPTVITEGDPTLTNARDPLPHIEMHDEIPADRLATTGDAVYIANGSPIENGGMVADHLGDSAWGAIPRTFIYPSPGTYDAGSTRRPNELLLVPVSGDLVLAGGSWPSTLYGVPFSYDVDQGTSYDVVMPVWGEDGNNDLFFAGWFVGMDVTVNGPASYDSGTNRITFTGPGEVELQATIVDVNSTRTISVNRHFNVVEA